MRSGSARPCAPPSALSASSTRRGTGHRRTTHLLAGGVPVRLEVRKALRGPHDFDAGNERRPRRSEEHTSELQSHSALVCRLLLEKKKRLEKGHATARNNRRDRH